MFKRIMLAAIFIVSAESSIADHIFLEIEGIEGDVIATGFEGQIELIALDWGISGPSAFGGCFRPEISVAKNIDSATADLIIGAVKGSSLGKTTIRIVRAVGRTRQLTSIFELDLQQATVSAFFSSEGDGGNLIESVRFRYFTIMGQARNIDGRGNPTMWDKFDVSPCS